MLKKESQDLEEKKLEEKRQKALLVFRESEEGRPCNIPLLGYFKRFSKKRFKSKVRVGEHKIHLFYKENAPGRLRGTIYRCIYTDTPYNFALLKGEQPICGIAFEAGKAAASASILVKQIQGVKDMRIELRPFRWEKMLLQILMDWAKQNGFERIEVVRAKSTEWWTKYKSERNKRLYMKYDVTARRMGCRLNRSELDRRKKVYSLDLRK